jgi:AcrR family transcriptional regulator
MQRRRLLLAMVEVAGEHGLERATVGQTCKRAGVSRRTFYDLFDDREGCFLAALELVGDRLAEAIAPALSERCWSERVRGALTVVLELFDREPRVARLCLLETFKGGPEVVEHRHAMLDVLAEAIDQGRQESKGANPPRLTAQSVVGGVLAVLQARVATARRTGGEQLPLLELVSPLMGMIVLPYLGQAASHREQQRPTPPVASEASAEDPAPRVNDPFKDLPIRITFRTVRVLETIGAEPDASNREIGRDAGVSDQGQMSKLLRRLERSGLIENRGMGQMRGERNAWRLTPQGQGVLHAVGADS